MTRYRKMKPLLNYRRQKKQKRETREEKHGRINSLHNYFKYRWIHFKYLLEYACRKPFYHQLKRAFYILKNEGIDGIRLRSRLIAASHSRIDGQSSAGTRIFHKTHNRQPLSYDHIEKYDFVFFDVFDTAIIRLFLKPVDLFKYLEVVTNYHGFHDLRVASEIKARKLLSGRKDISIVEIYKNLPFGKMETEIQAELKFCIANPEIFSLYSRAIAENKKVYFVSDTYLDKTTISNILEKNGYTIYEEIFVSSEDDLIKGDGSRFQWIKAAIPESVGTAIHIGDNSVADFDQPINHGFDAIRYIDNISYFRCDDFLFSKIDFLQSKDSLGLSFMIANFRYWKSGFKDSPTYWRQFGFLYGGALVVAFCNFVNNYLFKNNISCKKIFFLARDGDIISQVYQMFYDDVEAMYLLASRRCMAFPSLNLTNAKDSEALRWFAVPIAARNAKDVVERFGYDDLNDLEKDLEKCMLAQPNWSEKTIRSCILRHKNKIMGKVVAERNILMDYLLEIGFLHEEDIVICDVGWNGTIQDSLVQLLHMGGYSGRHLYGIYLGVNGSAAHEQNKTGFLFEGHRPEFADYINMIELITSSPMDEIVRIERIDGIFVPVGRPFNEDEHKRKLAAEEIQRGILDFAERIKTLKMSSLDFLRPSDFKTLFDSLRGYPSEEDVKQLGQLKHATMSGSNYDVPVINFNLSFIKLVVVFINSEMYAKFFKNNDRLHFYDLIGIDNRKLNRGLPVIYNEIIERHINEDCWLCFVHEDFEIKSDLSILANLDQRCVYGTFGVNFENQKVVIGYGRHICSNKDGSDPVEVGVEIHDPVKVQTLDCQCIMVHTSLLAKYPALRFDENLIFDLYAEDFSINALERYGITVKVVPLRFQHYSHGNLTERYYEGLRYLASKYSDVAVAGSCSFIGGRASTLEKLFKYNIRADGNRNRG